MKGVQLSAQYGRSTEAIIRVATVLRILYLGVKV